MKKAVAVAGLILLGCLLVSAWGGEFEVISQTHGVIVWRNPAVNSTCTVEWALAPVGPWHQDWTNFQNIVVTTPVGQARLPMFFRVVGSVPEDMPHTDMIAHYPLDGDANDATGNGHDGVLYGGTYVEDRYGTYQGAVEFDGSLNGYVDVGAIDIPLPATVSLWFRSPATNSAWRTLFGWNQASGPYSGIQFATTGNGRMIARMGNDTTDYYTTNRPDGDGRWHMLSASRDTSGIQRVYFDGVRQVAYSVQVSIGANHHLYLGRSFRPNSYSLNEHFRGALDDVRIYGRALTDEEIRSLWANSP